MARREVAVELILRASQYLREGRQVLGQTIATTRAVDDLGDKADATTRDMVQLAAGTELAKHQVDDLGDKAKTTAAAMTLLQSRIAASRLAVRGLALDFAATGEGATALGREQSELRRLERAARILTPESGGASLFNVVPRIGGVPGPLIAGGAAATAALAPFLGGVIAAAVLGSVGTGGVIGGIALASKDARVRTAWKELGSTVFTELGDASAPFVQPLLGVAESWGREWKAEAGPIRKIFTDLATTVEPLGKGVAGFVRELTPGLSTAVKASLPLAKQFSHEFERFGAATGRFLEEMAASAPGATIALHDLFTVTDEGLEQLGQGIHFLSETYEWSRKLGLVAPPEWLMQASKGLIPAVMDLAGGVQAYHRDLTKTIDPVTGLTRELKDQTAVIAELEAKYKSLADTMANQRRSAIDYKQALADLSQSVDDNGTSIDLNTQKGRDNARSFLDAAEAARRQRDDMIKAGVDTQTANLIMAGAMKAIEDQAGRNRKAVHDFIAELEAVPPVTTAQLLLEFSRTGLPGEHSGQRVKDTAPRVRTLSTQAFIEGLPTRDFGGPALAGQSYLLGGQPEVLTMGSQSGYVTPIGAGSDIDYGRLASAIVAAFHNSPIQLDGRVVTEQVTRRQTADAYARPGI